MVLKYELLIDNRHFIIDELLNPCLIEENIGSIETTVLNNKEKYFLYIENSKNLKKIEKLLDKLRIKYTLNFVEKLDKSYLTKYKESVKPVLIENILIKPSWSNILTIELDPQTAFGTGQHETTKLAIKALLQVKKDNNSLLDVGTGSGILSIVANFLKIGYIISLDNDFEATVIAKKNFEVNKFNYYNLFAGTFASLKNNLKFDIVIANIISSILLKEKFYLKNHVQENGYLILSGILKEELENFKQEFGFNGFLLENQLFINEWSCLIYRKRSCHENNNK